MTVPAPEDSVLERVSILGLVAVLLRRRRTLVLVPLALAILTYVGTSLWPKSYTAAAMLSSASPGASGGAASSLANIAAQFGVSSGSSGVGPGYYAQVLAGQNLLGSVVSTRFPRVAGGDTAGGLTLVEYYKEGGRSRLDSVQRAVRELTKHIVVEPTDPSGVFKVQFDSHEPALSLAVTQRLVQALTEFSLTLRGNTARSKRVFLESSLSAATDSLDRSRRILENFLIANRTWQSSPRLVIEKGRLDMDVAMRTQVQQGLAGQLESARIEEVNTTPVLTIMDEPILPTIPSSPQRLVLTALAFVLGVLLAILIVVAREFDARMTAAGSADYAQVRALAAQVLRWPLALWRMLPFRR